MALQSPPPAIPFEWTRANTQHFIELLKEHPSVWNIKSKQYKMRNVRSASLETIKSDLSNFANCTLRVEDITKKLHTLKTQFNREMSAIKASQKSGAGTDDIYTPKLWCFDELRFLADGEPRPSMSNLDEGETTTAQIDVVATLPSQEDAVESPDISLPPTPSLTSACSVATSRTPSPLPSSSSGGTSNNPP
uniref:MADF domain-containing protein n=1 Tax=Scylla olivacea TaxID=85551 RepID=A0A0P4VTV1_SCYOL